VCSTTPTRSANPVELMIEEVALCDLENAVAPPHDAIVDELYRRQIKNLLEARKLKPEDGRTVNTVFFVNSVEDAPAAAGDIVIPHAAEKLRDIARQLARR
jgi:hypothetical protein